MSSTPLLVVLLLLLSFVPAAAQEDRPVPLGLADTLTSDTPTDDPVTAAENRLRLAVEQFLLGAQGETIRAFDHAVDTYHDSDVPIPPVDLSLERHIEIERRLGQLRFTSEALKVVAGLTDSASQYRSSLHSSHLAEIQRARSGYQAAIASEQLLLGRHDKPFLIISPDTAFEISQPSGHVPFLLQVSDSPVYIDQVELLTVGESPSPFLLAEERCTSVDGSPSLFAPGSSCLVSVTWDLPPSLSSDDYSALLVVTVRGHPSDIAQTFHRSIRLPSPTLKSWRQDLLLASPTESDPAATTFDARLTALQRLVDDLQVPGTTPAAVAEDPLLDAASLFPSRLRLLSLSSVPLAVDSTESSSSALIAICLLPSEDGSVSCHNAPTLFVRTGDALELDWTVSLIDLQGRLLVLDHPDQDAFELRASSRRIQPVPVRVQASLSPQPTHSHSSSPVSIPVTLMPSPPPESGHLPPVIVHK